MGFSGLLVRDIFHIIEYLNKEQDTTILLVEQIWHWRLPAEDMLANGQHYPG